MRSRTIAIISSVAALSFVATPALALAATSSHATDSSRDARGISHVDKTPDRHSADSSRDKRDR